MTTPNVVYDMEEDPLRRHRRWVVALFLGLALHTYAASHSDLGLDAHVRLNALNDEVTQGQDLTWGSPRISGSSTLNTTSDYDGYIPPWNTTEASMKVTAVLSLVLVAGLVSLRPRRHGQRPRFDPMWGAMLMLSPVLMFSTSRGYDEAPLALLMGLGVSGYWFHRGETASQQRLNGVLMATSVMLVMVWKGFSPWLSALLWLVILLLAEAWVRISRTTRVAQQERWYTQPWTVGLLVFALVYLGITIIGFFSSTGTFSVIGERPLHFAFASMFAFIDAVVLYLLVGCFLWSFIAQRWAHLRHARGPGFTMLVAYIGALLAGIVAYIASLWTLEAWLWGMKLPQVMIILGNNGRYATLLLVPMVALLRWADDEALPQTTVTSRPQLRAVMLVLPFLLFTTLVGHQIWSEDAGEALAETWGDDDDTFLLIAPESMAVHHLYVVKTNLDLTGTESIQGWWSTSEEAGRVMDEHASVIDYVLVAPSSSVQFNASSWVLVESRDVPVSIPAGIQDGEWMLYRAAM